jgi:hypothetical protein
MDFGKSFVADSKTMEIMEPSMSTFNYPSIFSEATAMLGAALRKNGFDTPDRAISAGVLRSRICDRRRRFEAFSKGDREYHGWVESRQ